VTRARFSASSGTEMIRIVALTIAVGVLAGSRFLPSGPTNLPLVQIPQGVSARTFDGKRVFVVRDGEVLHAYLVRSGRFGEPVRWCPREQLFWSPARSDLFDRAGRRVFGPVRLDMLQVPLTITPRLLVTADVDHPDAHPASKGEIDPAVFEFYQRFLNQSDAPLSRPLVFCPDPLM